MLTAIAWPTPHHRLRRSLPSRGSLLMAALPNNHKLSRSSSAPNHRPAARRCNRRGLVQHGHRGKRQKRAGGACSRPGGSSFSLPRGAQGHSQFYSIDFYVTTQPSLILSWAPRKNRSPRSPLSPRPFPALPPRKKALPFMTQAGHKRQRRTGKSLS